MDFAVSIKNGHSRYIFFIKFRVFFDRKIRKIIFLGITLAVLYINILGMTFPLQGYGREACLSEAAISILYISSAFSGLIAPAAFPRMVQARVVQGSRIF